MESCTAPITLDLEWTGYNEMVRATVLFLAVFNYLYALSQDSRPANYAYSLPYKKGKSYLLIQGYNGKLSHKNELARDFKMKRGTIVCAARSGIVADLKEDSDMGGYKAKYIQDGNYVIVKHDDGSFAWYWHLKKKGVLVDKGDKVEVGNEIALSGNSGYSAFPHLHFEVVLRDSTSSVKQIPTPFRTRKGIKFLKAGRFYRNK